MVFCTATSLDGFITRPEDQVDWPETVPNSDQLDYGYGFFYASIDTKLMGNNIYQTVLGFGGDFPYSYKPDLVRRQTPLNSVFLRVGLIDKLIITLIPVLLGTGIPLLSDPVPETHFHLLQTETFETGFVQPTYVPARSWIAGNKLFRAALANPITV